MFFIILLALTTFCIAASAAFFSVFGMMQTYSAIAIPILIMGASLELGKLVTASVLYRMWDSLKSLKYYLIAALLGLMLMTSLGIFGYLTAGYQRDSVPLEQIDQKLITDKQEIDRLILRKKEIDEQIAKLPNNYVSSRQKLMTSFDPELKSISPRIDALQKEIAEYQTKKIDTEAHIGPIIYVAKVLGRNPDESVFWFTLLIMSVFDPLAVALTLATNMAIKQRKDGLAPAPTEPTYGPPPANLVAQRKEFQDAMQDLVQKESEAIPTPMPTPTPESLEFVEKNSHTSNDIYRNYKDEYVYKNGTPVHTWDHPGYVWPTPTPTPEAKLTKEDVVQIVKDSINTEELEAAKTRSNLLAELRKQ